MTKRLLNKIVKSISIIIMIGCAQFTYAQTTSKAEWQYVCNEDDRCFALLTSNNTRVAFAKDKGKKQVFGSIILPASVEPNSSVVIYLPNEVSLSLTVTTCSETFCEAIIDVQSTQIVIDNMKAVNSGILAYLNQSKISIAPISLKGFSEAVGKLK